MTGLAEPSTPPATTTAQEAFSQLSGRSPLLGWMRQHHALITERMNTVRPSWDSIARTLAGLGIRDANGEPPKTEAVRRAYHRVTGALNAKGLRRRRSKAEIAVAKAGTARSPATASTAAPTPPPPVAPPATAVAPPHPSARPTFDPTEGAFDLKPPPRFKPASLK
ncbi:hypothetical protein D9599_26400 [Roseomonas sp. KE2513]|nr:hypothetical protein [Roseomonas sp. KE2513]